MQLSSLYVAYRSDNFLNFLSAICHSSKKHRYLFTGSTSNGLEALGYILTHHPKMVILENNLTHLTSMDIIRILVRKEMDTKCIVIFPTLEDALSQETYFQHISGIILETDNRATFLKCLDEVASGNPFAHPEISNTKPWRYKGLRGTT